jgi:DNA-binding transcriptional LysR family regulator
MDRDQLEAVVAVARHASFTRAAEALAIGQPSVSRHVRRLEHELGVQLFERTTKRVVTTQAGIVLVDRAQQFLSALESLSRDMKRFSVAPRGLVRLGAWLSMSPGLPAILAEFVEANPDVDITIKEVNSPEIVAMLRSNDLDVGIATLGPDFDLHDLSHRVCVEEPFVLIVPPKSPYADRRSATFQDIADIPLIMHKPGSAIRRLIEHSFAASGRTPRVIVETNEMGAARRLVAQGIGAAIVPQSVAEVTGPAVGSLRLVPKLMRISILVWRRDVTDPAVHGFVEHMSSRAVNSIIQPPDDEALGSGLSDTSAPSAGSDSMAASSMSHRRRRSARGAQPRARGQSPNPL